MALLTFKDNFPDTTCVIKQRDEVCEEDYLLCCDEKVLVKKVKYYNGARFAINYKKNERWKRFFIGENNVILVTAVGYPSKAYDERLESYVLKWIENGQFCRRIIPLKHFAIMPTLWKFLQDTTTNKVNIKVSELFRLPAIHKHHIQLLTSDGKSLPFEVEIMNYGEESYIEVENDIFENEDGIILIS